MTTETDSLREIAEKAPKGPWRVYQHFNSPMPDLFDVVGATRDDDVTENQCQWVAEYLAAFDPPTVLALLAQLAETRERLERAECALRHGQAAIVALYTTIARGDAGAGERFAAGDPGFQAIRIALTPDLAHQENKDV